MADDPHARPVLGEIMSAGQQPARERRVDADVADADFETIPGTPRSAKPSTVDPVGTQAADAVGMDMLKPRSAADGTSRGGPAFWVFGLALAAGAFWVSGGHALIREQTTTSPVQTIPGPSFRVEDVVSRIEDAGGRKILFVDGAAVNAGTQPAILPSIEIRVTDGGGRLLRYKLGTAPAQLAPGARYAFSSRLEAPTDGVKSVQVTFTDEPS